MTLDDRLQRARMEYRAAVPPGRADRLVRLGSAEPAKGRTGRLVLASLVLVGLVAGLAALVTADRKQERPADTDVEVVDRAVDPKDAQPAGADAVYDPAITLAPDGPYGHGQSIELKVPEGYATDLINGGVQLCATLADTPGGPEESCDPIAELAPSGRTATMVTVEPSRSVFTPLGFRDCNEPEVVCRLVVGAADGQPRASAPLDYVGEPVAREVTLAITATEPPGTFVARPRGLMPDPSWLDLRASDPTRVEGFGPFVVQVCAFTSSDETDGPFGEYLWSHSGQRRTLPPANCNNLGETLTIDPDDPDRPLEVEISPLVFGYRGWSDCLLDQCFVQVRRTIVHGFEPGGGLLGSDVAAAATLLDFDPSTPVRDRPSITVETPGPHPAGKEITVIIGGLPEGTTTSIRACDVESPWNCGDVGSTFATVSNGEHTFRLPGSVARCGPEECYLQLDSQGEGLPPLATAALDTPG